MDVEDDRVGTLGLELPEGGLGAAHDERGVTEFEEKVPEDVAEIGRVLYDEHSHDIGSLPR